MGKGFEKGRQGPSSHEIAAVFNIYTIFLSIHVFRNLSLFPFPFPFPFALDPLISFYSIDISLLWYNIVSPLLSYVSICFPLSRTFLFSLS